jgi:hypothetical protein
MLLQISERHHRQAGGLMSNRRLTSPNAPGGALDDIVADASEHLTQRQRHAAAMLLADLRRLHGSSVGLVSNITEKIDAGRMARLRPPGGEPATYDRRLGLLREHERRLLGQLITAKEKPRGSLSDIGRLATGYGTQKCCRAAGLGLLIGLLNSLAEIYLGPARQEA